MTDSVKSDQRRCMGTPVVWCSGYISCMLSQKVYAVPEGGDICGKQLSSGLIAGCLGGEAIRN